MPEKEKLDKTIESLQKQFGEESILILGDQLIPQVEVISTGSLGLDIALGVGGLPRGRITEVYGPDASGKTTLCLHVIAEAQKLGEACAYIDMENALDLNYAAALGVDAHKLIFSQPDYGEQALAIVEELVKSKQIGVIVVDSVAALIPRTELEGDMTDQAVGMQARMMSKALRKLSGAIRQSGTILIFINQLRQKIGVMFGPSETTTGGMALKFYASVRLDIRRIQTLKENGDASGNRTRVRVVKNKVAPPLRQAEFDIVYGKGINHYGELVDLGVRLMVLTKRGAFYYLGEQRLGQGRDNVCKYLEGFPELSAQIDTGISRVISSTDLLPSTPPAGEEVEPEF